MKKKLLSMFLCLMLVLGFSSIFVGCIDRTNTNPVVVTINLNDSPYYDSQDTKLTFNVKNGTFIDDIMPESSLTNYVYLEFDYWCTDSNLSQKFNPNSAIYQDITLYAKWKFNPDYTFVQISTASMQASGLNVNDIVIVKYLSAEDTLNKNDIILYNYNSYKLLHLIDEIITNEDGSISYKTKGSSNLIANTWTITKDDIVGKFVEKVYEPEMYVKYTGVNPV